MQTLLELQFYFVMLLLFWGIFGANVVPGCSLFDKQTNWRQKTVIFIVLGPFVWLGGLLYCVGRCLGWVYNKL